MPFGMFGKWTNLILVGAVLLLVCVYFAFIAFTFHPTDVGVQTQVCQDLQVSWQMQQNAYTNYGLSVSDGAGDHAGVLYQQCYGNN
jgi:hypothetical protein